MPNAPITVGFLRQQTALCDADTPVILITDDPTVPPLGAIRAFPDKVEDLDKLERARSVFKLLIGVQRTQPPKDFLSDAEMLDWIALHVFRLHTTEDGKMVIEWWDETGETMSPMQTVGETLRIAVHKAWALQHARGARGDIV